jgi:hypothetical protein
VATNKDYFPVAGDYGQNINVDIPAGETSSPAPDDPADDFDFSSIEPLDPETPASDAPPTETQVAQEPPATPIAEAPAQSSDTGTPPAEPAPDAEPEFTVVDLLDVSQPAQTPPTETPAPAAEADWVPFPTMVNMPPQIMEMIRSEDDAVSAQGMSMVVTAVANKSALAAVEYMTKTVLPKFQERYAQERQVNEHLQQIQTDFYQAFPDLRAHAKLVEKATNLVIKRETAKNPNAVWGPAIRDQVGKTTRSFLQTLGVAQPVAPPAPPAPAFVSGGSRPGGHQLTPTSVSDEIEEMFKDFA